MNTQINILNISKAHPYYQQERELRNKILLRPIGVPDYAWEMKDDIAWHFVAEQDQRVIGCVLLAPSDDDDSRAQLLQMAISEDFQAKGVGKLLVHYLFDFADRHSVKEVFCHSRDYAVKFYEKLGFETYGEPFEEVGILHRYMRVVI